MTKQCTSCGGFCGKVCKRENVAQLEQEPVAYFNPQVKGFFYWAKPTKITAPIAVSVEPIPLYTTPPQRAWVGLTEKTFAEACQMAERGNYLVAFKLIQTELKDLNT